ncbi:sodium:proton antiporter [Dactylosporangium sp. CA-139066]|uniref:sodium:proton antiporter n=1 Tax=Dactylosporangium sp. CA-139066 TaxID=3239930 RepID=UPI003D8EFC24
MIVANYLAAAALFGLGLYTVLTRRNIIKIVMGLSLMEASGYLLLLSMAYRAGSTAPVLINPPHRRFADPMLQNICLTAIVIGVAITGVFLAVVVRLAQHHRTLDAGRIRDLRG